MQPPFTLLDVSWPQPVQIESGRWTSDPVWDAPPMEAMPRWQLHLIGDDPYWLIDWRDFFRSGNKCWNPHEGGEMRGFHVVFRIETHQRGRLVFWDDDGSIVKRNGLIAHEDRAAHSMQRHELEVETGDILEVAQWQLGWGWQWCAALEKNSAPGKSIQSSFLKFHSAAESQLKQPNGPALKMYTNGSNPLRAIAGIYSMLLNGYTPSSILLFGEEQWPERSRSLFSQLLPFARVVPLQEALSHIRRQGGESLVTLARNYWFVMKACVALFIPPGESCLMDDDVFILDSVDDALSAFLQCDLVYTPDQDLGHGYLHTWGRLLGHNGAFTTGRFNAGLYWVRQLPDAHRLALNASRCRPGAPVMWEQGLVAVAYARRRTHQLPSQRYLFVIFDGLPGGMHGYDYAKNPCRYSSIHYGGMAEKPSDGFSLQVLSDILERSKNPALQAVSVG
jgi:hypothetical protein